MTPEDWIHHWHAEAENCRQLAISSALHGEDAKAREYERLEAKANRAAERHAKRMN